MNVQTVKAIAKIRQLNQSDLAGAAGVSRQSVSLWFQNSSLGFVNIRTKHLLALAESLNVSADTLLQPLPLLANQSNLKTETTKLLWDKLYPDVLTLILAALDGRHDAMARMVQVYGLYKTAKLIGSQIWRDFPRYKRHLKSSRRVEMERVWTLRLSLTKT